MYIWNIYYLEYPNVYMEYILSGISQCIYGHINIILIQNYIVKIIQTTFYEQQPHKYFNLTIFNDI